MIIMDSSTLILLSKIDILGLFIANFPGRILIPQMVKEEVCIEGMDETPLIIRLIEKNKIKVLSVKDSTLIKKLMSDFNIGIGETEAILLALQEKVSLIGTDDRNAIRACKILQIEFTTAIAILIRSVEHKLIDKEEAIIKLKKLESVARYAKSIIEDAKKRIEGGE